MPPPTITTRMAFPSPLLGPRLEFLRTRTEPAPQARRSSRACMPGIHPSAGSGVRGRLDPGDKRRDDLDAHGNERRGSMKVGKTSYLHRPQRPGLEAVAVGGLGAGVVGRARGHEDLGLDGPARTRRRRRLHPPAGTVFTARGLGGNGSPARWMRRWLAARPAGCAPAGRLRRGASAGGGRSAASWHRRPTRRWPPEAMARPAWAEAPPRGPAQR